MKAKGIEPQPGVFTDREGEKTYIPATDAAGRTPGARLAGSTAGHPRAGRTSELHGFLPGSGRGAYGA